MAKLKRSCEKCSNRVGENYCTMQKDMKKAETVLCEGFKVVPKILKPVWKEEKKETVYEADEGLLGSDFYKFLKTGGHWSFNLKIGNQRVGMSSLALNINKNHK